jgi:citrate lyase subunit beta/citryl-CoA lyase
MVVVDLEDAVAASNKAVAREALAQQWSTLSDDERSRCAVRVNAIDSSWHLDDLAVLRSLKQLGAAMLPKAAAAEDFHSEGFAGFPAPWIALIESAQGIANARRIAQDHTVARLAFGHLDFQLDLGIESGLDERELDAARFELVLASKLGGLAAPIDGVTVQIKDDARLIADSQRAKRQGFGAKLCIHPAQVGQVNHVFRPSDKEIAWAERVLHAAALCQTDTFQFEGEMVDAPVLKRARRIVEASGFSAQQ